MVDRTEEIATDLSDVASMFVNVHVFTDLW